MKISDFNYELPSDLIADTPPEVRGTSRLLVLDRKTGFVEDKKYSEISDFLEAGDLVVLNDTKVIKARLITKRQDGSDRELIILEKHGENDNWHLHKVLYHKKIYLGEILKIGNYEIKIEEILPGGVAVVSSSHDLIKIADELGEMPLPPYMKRRANSQDNNRYQTVWAKNAGSVAAPTASLNMTDDIIDALKRKGVGVAYLTLHVGLGTFLPIRTDDVEDHVMHKEYFEIPSSTVDLINSTKNNKKRVVAVGTTVARTLEYANKLFAQQGTTITGEADIFIYPGYEFKVVDCLITNYHAPKSTVLMLASAFAGWDNLRKAYKHAVDEKYHFLSYGDSMLIK